MQEYVPRVFISSRFDEFREIKTHLKEQLRDGRGGSFYVVDFDEPYPHEQPPITVSLRAARTSDVVLVLIGSTYGPPAPGRKVSFVEAEYDAAHNGRVAMILPHYICSTDEPPQDESLALLLGRIKGRHKYVWYDNRRDAKEIAVEIKLNLIHRWGLSSSTGRLQGVDLSMIDEEFAGADVGELAEADRRIEAESRLSLDDGTESWSASRLAANPAFVAAAEQKREASQAMSVREWHRAADHLNRALKHRPWDLAALYWAARVRIVTGEPDASRHALVLAKKAIRFAEAQARVKPSSSGDIALAAVLIVAARAAEIILDADAGVRYAQRAVDAAATYWLPKYELGRQAALAQKTAIMRTSLRRAFLLRPNSLFMALIDPAFGSMRSEVRRVQEDIRAEILSEIREILRVEHRIASRASTLAAMLPQGTSVLRTELAEQSLVASETALTSSGERKLLALLETAQKSFERQLQLLRGFGAEALALAAQEPVGPERTRIAQMEHGTAAARIQERRRMLRSGTDTLNYEGDARVKAGGYLAAAVLALVGLNSTFSGRPGWGIVTIVLAVLAARAVPVVADFVGKRLATDAELAALEAEEIQIGNDLAANLATISEWQQRVATATAAAANALVRGVADFETASLKKRIYCPTAAIDRAATGSLLLLNPSKHGSQFSFRASLLPDALQKWDDGSGANRTQSHLYTKTSLEEDGKPVVSRTACYFSNVTTA